MIGLIMLLVLISIILQIAGYIYFMDNITRILRDKDIIIGDIIMAILAPVGLVVVIIVILIVAIIVGISNLMKPIWYKRIIK